MHPMMMRQLVILILLALFLPELTAAEKPAGLAENPLVLTDILIRGNEELQDDEVAGMLGWEIGQPFSSQALARGESSLLKTRLFERVWLSTRPGSEPGEVVALVRVREKSFPLVNWFEHETRPDGNTWDLVQIESFDDSRRFFNGVSFGFGTWIALRANSMYRITSQPARLLHLSGMAGTTTYNVVPNNIRSGWMFALNSLQGGFGYTTDVGFPSELTLQEWFEYYNIYSSDLYRIKPGRNVDNTAALSGMHELPVPFRQHDGSFWTAVEVVAEDDTRDEMVYTTQGHWFRFPVRFGFNPDQNDSYYKASMDIRTYREMEDGNVIATRGYFGYASAGTPFFHRFYLSRGYSSRGVNHGWVDPVYGGRYLYFGAMELRHPVFSKRPDPFLLFLLFAEAGANWNDEASDTDPLSYNSPTVSTGFGFVFKVPVLGPVNLSAGTPLLHQEGGHGWWVYLQLGFMI